MGFVQNDGRLRTKNIWRSVWINVAISSIFFSAHIFLPNLLIVLQFTVPIENQSAIVTLRETGGGSHSWYSQTSHIRTTHTHLDLSRNAVGHSHIVPTRVLTVRFSWMGVAIKRTAVTCSGIFVSKWGIESEYRWKRWKSAKEWIRQVTTALARLANFCRILKLQRISETISAESRWPCPWSGGMLKIFYWQILSTRFGRNQTGG